MREKILEEMRETYAKYFYMKGDDEAYQDICTMSEERLIYHAINFAKLYFEEGIKRIEEINSMKK